MAKATGRAHLSVIANRAARFGWVINKTTGKRSG